MSEVLKKLHQCLQLTSGAIFPPRCLSCREHLTLTKAQGRLMRAQVLPDCGDLGLWFCGQCEKSVRFAPSASCEVCSTMATFLDEPAGEACEVCRDWQVPWGRSLAAFEHGGAVRRALHRLKFEGGASVAWGLSGLMAARMLSAGQTGEGCVFVPVPSSVSGLMQRGYNQATLLAAGVSERLGGEVMPSCLKRIGKREAAQHNLKRNERLEGLTFCASEPNEAMNRAILVDDVMTTGSTLMSAGRALSQVGWEVELALVCTRA